ncbi:hypothetical protein [Streptomyces sp.]|uniref:hypothetical protein n=1 Tax=Streptomyces sp. TaxID=1931 RepID=UPI002F9259DE
MNVNRFRHAAVVLAAVALTAAVTGCQKDDTTAGSTKPSAVASSATKEPAAAKPTVKPAAKPASKPSKKAVSKKPTGKPAAKPAPDCVTAPPNPDAYDPDEFALYRIEELPASTGKVNLVLQHGAWGCGDKDTDGAPFVVSGEDSRWALDQAAYVTATNPIVETTENQRIGVQELIDWVKAHPNSGLIFKYQTGDDGAIHRLEQVFTP